jgi:membrane peptidoglycan carboxypeptidase
VAADVTFALQQVVKGGTGSAASSLPFPVAGKTGTSTGPRSVWFVGYTPTLSTSVVMYQLGKEKVKVNGKNKTVLANVVMKGFGDYPNGIFGGGYPLHIWMSFMEQAMKNKTGEFPPRADVGVIKNRAPVVIVTTPPVTATADPGPQQTTQAPPTQNPTEPADPPNPTETTPGPTFTRPGQPTTDPTDPGNGGGGGDDDEDQ